MPPLELGWTWLGESQPTAVPILGKSSICKKSFSQPWGFFAQPEDFSILEEPLLVLNQEFLQEHRALGSSVVLLVLVQHARVGEDSRSSFTTPQVAAQGQWEGGGCSLIRVNCSFSCLQQINKFWLEIKSLLASSRVPAQQGKGCGLFQLD